MWLSPRGMSKSDEFFGDVEVFYEQLDVSSTVTTSLEKFHVLVTYQGLCGSGTLLSPADVLD